MKHLLRTLYFILLVLAFVLPTRYELCGVGVIMASLALVTAAAILHPTERQEGAYFVASIAAVFWVGVVFLISRDFMLALLALLFFGAGVMVLLMMGGSYLWNGPDDLLPPDRDPMLKLFGRALLADLRRGRDERKQREWTMRRTLQFTLWVCVFASAAVMLSGFSIVLALTLSVAAIALTFSYEGSSVGRVRSTYGAFASLCLIGVLGPWSLGALPLIFLVMLTIMALVTRS